MSKSEKFLSVRKKFLSIPITRMSSSTTTNPRSTNVPHKNKTKKKKEAFKGDVEGMGGAVLQLPKE